MNTVGKWETKQKWQQDGWLQARLGDDREPAPGLQGVRWAIPAYITGAIGVIPVWKAICSQLDYTAASRGGLDVTNIILY